MEHIEQYHLKFGDVSHNLKQRECKVFMSCCFPGHNLHVGAKGFAHACSYICFSLQQFFFLI